MIRALLITTVISFLVAVLSLTASANLGMSGHWPQKLDWRWPDDRPGVFTGDPGPCAGRTYAWTGDDSLDVNLAGEVIYTQGPDAKVTITAPQAVLDRVRVEGEKISLTGGRMNLRDANILIEVQAPSVREFRFNGGQKVSIKSYAQDELAIEANGAADIKVEGAARLIDLRMNGAGHADLSAVANDEAKVELNGASHASLSPKASVDIRINGVGNVALGSRPARIKQEIHGIGSVSFTTDEDAPAAPAAPAPPKPPKGPATDT